MWCEISEQECDEPTCNSFCDASRVLGLIRAIRASNQALSITELAENSHINPLPIGIKTTVLGELHNLVDLDKTSFENILKGEG